MQRFKGSRNELFFLALTVSLAIVLRAWDLGAAGFNNDEAIYGGQAAALAGYDNFQEHFSIFRAHPLLLQFTVSFLVTIFGVSDTVSRIPSVLFGVCTIILTYIISKNLYDQKIAIFATFVIAILPYHILLSRQVLLDVALTFFYTLTLYFVICHLTRPKDSLWLYLIGASAGLSFLSKEVGIFALASSIACLFIMRTVSLRNLLVVTLMFFLTSSPYWVPILIISEANEAAVKYWNWQTSRDPNQSETFYATLISQEALGYVLTALCVLSIIHALKTKKIKRPAILLLLIWISFPLALFHLLAVKGFAFILPIIPVFVILGTSFLFSDWIRKIPGHRVVLLASIPMIFIFSSTPLHYIFQIPPTYLVGSGEEPHARAAAKWIDANIPDNARFLTLDIRTANIIKYYSNNEAVSLHSNQNPSYSMVSNSDLAILNDEIDYLVYDVYLSERFQYLKEEEAELNKLIIKYNGSPIHKEYETTADSSGQTTSRPAIIIYSLTNISRS